MHREVEGPRCYKGAKAEKPPAPAPIPKQADATEAVDQTLMDQRKFRRGFLSSYSAGEAGGNGMGGNTFLGQ